MAAIYREDIVDVELTGGSLYRSFKCSSIGSGDALANRFGVRLLRDNEEVLIGSGSVEGFFLPPTGDPILIQGSTYTGIDGAVAYVILPQACYNYDGKFTLAIKIISEGVTGTMRIVDGVVDNTNSGSAVAPTGTVPTYQEILAQYAAMQAATVTAQNAADYVADEYAIPHAYAVGDYCIYDGALYRCTTAISSAGETWTPSHWTEVSLGEEVTDLNNAITNITPVAELISGTNYKIVIKQS